jgi:hypothetical protein
MAWKITFNIIGDTFDPNKVNFDFDNSNIATDIAVIGKSKGKPYGYGSASYTIPQEVPRPDRFNHLANLFEPKLEELKHAGAESWWIEIGRLYSHQCNEELSVDEIAHINRLKCSVSYSAYNVSEKELEQGWD